MFAHGGKLLVSVILLWVFATFGIDFLSFDPGTLPKLDLPKTQPQVTTPTAHAPEPPVYNVEFARTENLIAIGSFNIQVFGESKINKPEVVAILADIVRQFDVIAIQEIRAQNQELIPYFVQVINQTGARYSYVIGARQGRTVSKEQYAYIYDTTRIELTDPGYLVPDPDDRMHREPMVSSFRTRINNGYQPFSFILVNTHTDPDEVPDELTALNQFYDLIRKNHPWEDDIILVGDFNADPNKFGDLGEREGIAFAVPPTLATNTRGTRNLDNIVFDRRLTTEYVGGGVLDIISRYNLTMEHALLVSDHMPVWGLFTVNERALPVMAHQPAGLR